MTQGFFQIAVFFAIVVAVVPLLGGYMARVFRDERVFLTPVVAPIERGIYRILRVDPTQEQDWKGYARSLLVFSTLFGVFLFVMLRTQSIHPFNPENFRSGSADLSFNTATSFLTNTNWQFYGGETTLSYFSQMAGLAVQNFLSAAVGISVMVALIRGIAARGGDGKLGNFYKDITRITFYILVPMAIVGTLLLVSQGVLQTLGGTAGGIARGPVASQEAIKMLGTNGGGFFNVNSSFPLENPTAFSNFLEMFMIICIPASLPY
ncbi:MAG TPA: potassium-transporting ATPase subunit KdpA, partial [Baekduia sp.]